MVQALCALGGPVFSPALELPAVVHSRYGLEVTFWQHHVQTAEAVIASGHIAAAMRRMHLTLAQISPDLRETLPPYTAELAYVRALNDDDARLSALSGPDRGLLSSMFDRLAAERSALSSPDSHVVIHGAPHLHNVLLVDGEPRFIDFETASVGPVEWDMAYLYPAEVPLYGRPVHERVLWVCRAMASVRTAIYCWADVERGDMRDHAEWHLAHIKRSVAPYVR